MPICILIQWHKIGGNASTLNNWPIRLMNYYNHPGFITFSGFVLGRPMCSVWITLPYTLARITSSWPSISTSGLIVVIGLTHSPPIGPHGHCHRPHRLPSTRGNVGSLSQRIDQIIFIIVQNLFRLPLLCITSIIVATLPSAHSNAPRSTHTASTLIPIFVCL